MSKGNVESEGLDWVLMGKAENHWRGREVVDGKKTFLWKRNGVIGWKVLSVRNADFVGSMSGEIWMERTSVNGVQRGIDRAGRDVRFTRARKLAYEAFLKNPFPERSTLLL